MLCVKLLVKYEYNWKNMFMHRHKIQLIPNMNSLIHYIFENEWQRINVYSLHLYGSENIQL